MAVLRSSQAQLTRNRNRLKQWLEKVALLGCTVFTIKILAGILNVASGHNDLQPQSTLYRQKLQFNIKGSNPLYLLSSWMIIHFLLRESQHHQLVLNMRPVVFDVYIKTVACAFIFKHSVLPLLLFKSSSCPCTFES